jgi:hypothetical protein
MSRTGLVTQRIDIRKLRRRAVSLLLVGALVTATEARAATVDPQASPNIPEVPEILVLPYAPASSPGAPRPVVDSADLPPPLARAPEYWRRPFELGLGLGIFLPSCGCGSIDARDCQTTAPGSGLDVALLYRVTPHFAAGAEGIVSRYRAPDSGPLSGGGGRTRFLGAALRLYFAEDGAWDPYLALTLGVGTLALGSSLQQSSTTGFGGRVEAGIDYALSRRFRLGPAGSLARWWSPSSSACGDGFCDPYGKPLGFATLGLRLTASFGDPL